MKFLQRFVPVLIAVLILVSFGMGFHFGKEAGEAQARKEDVVDSDFISERLTECSDLATAQLHYNGLTHYENGSIPFITQKKFTMTYGADILAGVDLTKCTVSVSDTAVEITLPEAQVLSISIDPDSLNFYDTNWALFNWDRRSDVSSALQDARDNLEENADYELLKYAAVERAKTVIGDFISPLIGERQLVVR